VKIGIEMSAVHPAPAPAVRLFAPRPTSDGQRMRSRLDRRMTKTARS
jgi:hypothetical protein